MVGQVCCKICCKVCCRVCCKVCCKVCCRVCCKVCCKVCCRAAGPRLLPTLQSGLGLAGPTVWRPCNATRAGKNLSDVKIIL